MTSASTVAARCASLSSAIAQIITDTAGFSRRLRDARHEVNAVNADLLAIRLSLDIAREDFSVVDASISTLLIEAMSCLLDCCSAATQSLHRPIVRLSTSDVRNEVWHIFKKGDFQSLRQDFQALRCALDLVLDIVVLFHDADDEGISYPSTQTRHFQEHVSNAEHPLLKRIDIERDHIEDLTEGRLPVLYTSFERLRACAMFILEEKSSMQQPGVKSSFGADSRGPACDDSARSGRNSPAPLPSPISTSNGIGAWIANVVSQIVHSPALPPDAMTITDPRTTAATINREESLPSRGTFYNESATSGSRTQSSGKHRSKAKKGNSQRVDSPQEGVKAPKIQQSTYYPTSTIISSEDASIIHRNLTSDKLAIAIDKRKHLTKNQRAAIDWDLRNISHNTSIDHVEQILWHGANPNADDAAFGSVFIKAAFELSTDVLRLLVEYGANVSRTTTSSYYSAIHAAVLGRRLDNLQYLVHLGMSIDTANTSGETPLHLAVKTPGAYQVAKWLLESGADVNRDANEEGTPFHVVMNATKLDSRERSMMVELLLAHGAEGEFSVETAERRGKGLSVLGLI